MKKVFKCPKCGGSQHALMQSAVIDGQPLRICKGSGCVFCWSYLADHLYLKDGEPEIVRCEIGKYIEGSGVLGFVANGKREFLAGAISLRGFSGFEFSDGSVSLESPWAWKDKKDGSIHHAVLVAQLMDDFTPVLAKFVRIGREG